MENWRIERSVAISPADGSDADAAYRVTVGYGEERAEVIVEFTAPSAVASVGYAEEIVRKYLKDDEPPQQVVVAPDGSVRIETEPLDTLRTPRSEHATPDQKRGRRRRR
ncbi:MAG TPA: hypothetical protein VGC78_00960 [Gaiellaceae bacterium]|jgi:hypothetical protein